MTETVSPVTLRRPELLVSADEGFEVTNPATGEVKALMVPHSDEQFFAVFDRVWAKYKGLTGKQLSDLTHRPGTPWSLARERGQQYIYNDDIQRHFVELATKNV